MYIFCLLFLSVLVKICFYKTSALFVPAAWIVVIPLIIKITYFLNYLKLIVS